MNNQMLAQSSAYAKVRAQKALAAATQLASDLTEVGDQVEAATETLTEVGVDLTDAQTKIAQLREDVDGLLA